MKAKMYFKYGTMGSSKTAQLLITDFNYKEKGLNTLLITSCTDDRDGIGKIKSRVGIEKEADIVVESKTDLYSVISKKLRKNNIDIVISEESQFLTKEQVEQLSDVVDVMGVTVVCFGLKTDFRNNLFEGSQRLLELADTIEEIKGMCHCGRKANCNMRLKNGIPVKEGEQIETGGNESYIAVCRKCWKTNKIN